jgi:aminoglycoside phosphotransferase family enzyme
MRFTTKLNPILFVARQEDPSHVLNIHIAQVPLSEGNPDTIDNLIYRFHQGIEKNQRYRFLNGNKNMKTMMYRLFVECEEGMVHVKSKQKINKNEFMSSDEVEDFIRGFAQKKIETPNP